MGERGDTEADAAKATLRAGVRASRSRRPLTEREAAAAALAQRAADRFASAGVVAAYASYGSEPGTSALRERLRTAGVQVLLPVVRGPDLHWVVDDGAVLVRGGERGMPEPTGPSVGCAGAGLVASRCTVVLLPALCVGLDGVRLGQGGGYYDRLLADLPRHPDGPLRVAVVYDDEVLPAGAVPAAAHDLAARVDRILTPARTIQVARTG
jgi:5-formyltetrahydrofolate cyclo-ligase